MVILGYGFKRVIVDPLIKHGVIPLVIATLGLSIAVKSIAARRLQRGSASVSPARSRPGNGIWPGLNVSYADVGTLVVAGAIVVGLQAFLNRTVTGRAMQAVAQNTEAAKVLGINVQRMVLYVFLTNALLGDGGCAA